MKANATAILEIELENPGQEEGFFQWIRDVRDWLTKRGHLVLSEVHVLARGRYLVVFGFPLPGGWGLLTRERQWLAIESKRPPARVTVRQGRLFHDEEAPRDITTSELRLWLEERGQEKRDFVLIDTLPAEQYEQEHLPGAVNFPVPAINEQSAALVMGPDKDRAVVVYCSSYG
ncbi:MAG: rhodanese-like domain-containing protein [Deltaproteobacteria bacterium]|nr:rhodanese-like domain-containing protein [Deltaproteobacteria bacterium]